MVARALVAPPIHPLRHAPQRRLAQKFQPRRLRTRVRKARGPLDKTDLVGLVEQFVVDHRAAAFGAKIDNAILHAADLRQVQRRVNVNARFFQLRDLRRSGVCSVVFAAKLGQIGNNEHADVFFAKNGRVRVVRAKHVPRAAFFFRGRFACAQKRAHVAVFLPFARFVKHPLHAVGLDRTSEKNAQNARRLRRLHKNPSFPFLRNRCDHLYCIIPMQAHGLNSD